MTDEELRRLRERAQQATIQAPGLSTDNGIKEGSTFGQPEVQGQTFNAPLQTAPQEQPESEVEKILKAYEKRKKVDEALDARSRSGAIVGGIADMARSLVNLYYTTKGSPNAFDPTQGMTARQREMYEKAKAARDANRNEWMHYALNVAGKKDAAAQAEKARQDRLALKKAEAEAKAKELQDKEDQQWVSDYLVPDWEMEYDKYDDVAKAKAAIEADLDDRHKKREITDGQLAAAKKRLEPTLKKRRNAKYTATEKQNQSIETSQRRAAATAAARGNNGGSKGNNHQYVGFADGGGVWINKNDVSDIISLYNRQDFPDAYKVRDSYGNLYPNASKEDKLNAVIHYLSLNRNNEYENWLRQVEKRPRTAKPQQPKPKGGGSLLPNQKGKTTGSLLPKK